MSGSGSHAGIVISNIEALPVLLGVPDGPLSGVRLAVKDNIDVEGAVTTEGSRFVGAEAPPARASAAVVAALMDAGAIPVAKVNMHEFAYGTTSANPWFGPVPNPILPGRIPGGSSGGSAAAIVAGLADLALGTDTAGSIRMPAACVGIVGLRPRVGVLELHGIRPLCPSFDTAGPMAASVGLVARAWESLLAGASASAYPAPGNLAMGCSVQSEPESKTLRPALSMLEGVVDGDHKLGPANNPDKNLRPRVAILDGDGWLPFQLWLILGQLGVEIVEHTGFGEAEITDTLAELWPAFRFEASATHAARFSVRAAEYDPGVARKLTAASQSTASQHKTSLEALGLRRRAFLTECAELEVDILISPTLGCPIPAVTEREDDFQDMLGRYCAVWSALNLPALAIGGVQIIGRTEADVLAFGSALERSGFFATPAPDKPNGTHFGRAELN